jgi:hypothetical protein
MIESHVPFYAELSFSSFQRPWTFEDIEQKAARVMISEKSSSPASLARQRSGVFFFSA